MPFPESFRGRMRGKVAIVTGAGSQGEGEGVGTGKAIAIVFAGEGARVCLADRDAPRAADTLARIEALGGEAFIARGDVTRDADCRRIAAEALERWGRLDALVNNVGISAGTSDLEQFDESAWQRVFDVNLKSAILMARHAVPAMLAAGGGAIVNISSVAGQRPHGHGVAYGPSKAAMNHLTRELAVMYGRRGIRVNTVAPGHIATPMISHLLSDDMRRMRRRIAPLGVEGDAWDVAGAVLFLASDEARFITGQYLAVDGGVTEIAPLRAHDLLQTPGMNE